MPYPHSQTLHGITKVHSLAGALLILAFKTIILPHLHDLTREQFYQYEQIDYFLKWHAGFYFFIKFPGITSPDSSFFSP